MAANRIQRFRFAAVMTAPEEPQKPASPVPAVPPGFAVCPPSVAAAQPWQQALYRQAYEQALAAAAIPRHYRLFTVWN
jgi:hypothetical protein